MADPILNRHSREDGKPDSTSSESLITQNIDIWTTAIERKSSAGRGTSNKFSLYGIKKLRELILELAVRGKLVPQDVNDEPASVLLKRIAAEKAQQVEEGKIRKPKSLPKISDNEKPFELPPGWAYERIGIFGIVGTGSTPSRSNPAYWEPPEINWVSSGETSDFFVAQTKEKVSNLAIKETNVSIYPTGTLIVAMYGQGKTRGQITELLEPAGTNQACAAISLVDKSVSHKNYVKLFFRKAYFELRKHAAGGAQPNLNVGKIASTVVPIPPIEEQHLIVAKVDELMSLCDALEAQTEASIAAHQTLVETLLNALLLPNTTQPADSQSASPESSFANSLEPALNESFIESWQRIAEYFDTLFTTEASIDTLKQTILQLAVMGKLVPQDPNDEPATKLLERIAAEKAQLIKDGRIKKQKTLPAITDEEKSFELPNGWVYTRLDELCLSVSSGSTPPKSELNETSGIPFLKVYNIQNQVIDFEERTLFVSEGSHLGKLKRSILYPGDVVMNLVGPPLGKIAIIPNTYPEWNCNQNIICFRPLEIRLNLYIYTYLTAQIFLNQIELVGSAGQDFISGTKSRAIVLPFPPLEEQHRIVAKVDELMTLCDQLKARLSDAQTTQLHLTDAIVEQAM
ncbi:restriction endonuclease subunit S [Shewanella vesiculosa]|uniref:restriction endonuclease subunit S n=1 Tax=Shewanella vesiculosa TaxID=518738 RepID=UPI003D045853